MKSKRGNEYQELGQSIVDGRLFFVCKLPTPILYHGDLISVVVMPASDFDYDNGLEKAEIIERSSEVASGENPATLEGAKE